MFITELLINVMNYLCKSADVCLELKFWRIDEVVLYWMLNTFDIDIVNELNLTFTVDLKFVSK